MMNKLKSNKDLLNFTILNILDKGFIFLIPLIVLLMFKDKVLYNQIEYIYAIANILIVFLDFGIKNYIFYKYKESDDKSKVLKNNRSYINSLFYFYFFIGLIFYIINEFYFNSEEFYIYFFILVRSVYSLAIAFYSYYFRLIDDPSKIYKYSLLVSLFTIFVILSIYILNISIELSYIFLFHVLLIIYFLFKGKKSLKYFKLKRFFNYIKESILYSYPIMINLVIITIINQFGKVYAYNFLSVDDMTALSFIQRLSLIIVLFHGSLSGYYAKKLFTSNEINIHKKILAFYIVIISSISIFVYVSIHFSIIWGYLDISLLLVIVMLLSTFIWCINAYIELYFNRNNKNKYIPLITLIGFLIYVLVLYFNKIDLDILIYSILVSNSISLLFGLTLLKKKVKIL